jgi:hypothetical protein
LAASVGISIFFLFKEYKEIQESKRENARKYVTESVIMIKYFLESNEKETGRYPASLFGKYGDLIFSHHKMFPLTVATEKKYFGRSIEPTDYKYTSDGNSYELCLEINNIKYCAKNSR